MKARPLSLPPDPIRLARALRRAGLPHVTLLQGRERAWVTAAPDAVSGALDPMAGEPVEAADVPRWIGVIPYEARRGLERPSWRPEERRPAPRLSRVRWLRYPTVARVTDRVVLLGDDDAHARALHAALERPAPPGSPRVRVAPADAAEAHLGRVREAIELIAAGDLYQVNLARRLDVTLRGDPLDLYAQLHRGAPSAYAAAIETPDGWALSTSPELLLHLEVDREGRPRRTTTVPIKGTRPRSDDPERDARLAAELEADPKERAELAMIVDVARHDLGAISERVTVSREPSVQSHATVHHRSAEVRGSARAGVDRAAVLEAMVPSGSVTGAPKVRAMEVIAALEAHRRGLYTGGFGYVAADGSAVLAMAIRTLALDAEGPERGGSYFTGGGIVIGSDPERELEETGWKAAQLARATTASDGA